MKTVKTNQLLINDITSGGGEINIEGIARDYLGSLGKITVVSGAEIMKDVLSNNLVKLLNIDKVILPGEGSNIFMDLIQQVGNNELLESLQDKGIRISPTRELKNMVPVGLEIRDEDMYKLADFLDYIKTNSGKGIILDDVVASGTTINGIVKALNQIKSRYKIGDIKDILSIITLVLRNSNTLSKTTKNIDLISGLQVEGTNGAYPRINTLSTMIGDILKANLVRNSFIAKGVPAENYDLFINNIKKLLLP